MHYAYMKREDAINPKEADIIRIGAATQEELADKIAHYTSNGFVESTHEEFVAAGNPDLDNTDESPNEGDAADVTGADLN